ncbi:hypothetical protein ACHAXA_000753 [Cyclostephanos tholiformis]|uniref:FH2 domain-containing protein n=1 Tax=Cyclostephanos tholiformis TaxID=382380 RepID=A0ABD3RU70_9STRA
MFLAGLRREVAGDHTKLWSGFQSLLGRSPEERVPLYRSKDDEVFTGKENGRDHHGEDDGRGEKTRKEKIRMDPRTQGSLTAIHRHLMENERVKSRFMTTTSQLVNDKKFKRECVSMMEDMDLNGRYVPSRFGEYERTTTDVGKYGLTSTEGEQRTNAAYGELPCHDNDASSHPSNDSCDGDRRQLRQQQERAKNESWLQYYEEKNSSQLAGKDNPRLKSSSSSSTSPSLSSPTKGGNLNKTWSPFSIKLRRVGKGDSGGSPPDGIDDNNDDGGASAAVSVRRQRIAWIEALKMKQKSLSLKQLDNDPNGSVHDSVDESRSPGDGSPTIVGKTLRNLSPRKKTRLSPPTTPVGSTAPPWLKVQLRPTPTPTPKKPTKEPSASPPAGRPTLQTIGSNGSCNCSSSGFVLTPVSHTSNDTDNAPTSSTLPPLFCVGDIIDLDALPKRGFPPAEGEVAIFPLKQSARDPSRGGGEDERFVIVGKTVMVTATAKNFSTGGPRKATVTWWCHRCEIRAMTLNVEATGANLAHAHGRMPLLFETADVCLDFAQAFYRGPAAPVVAVGKNDDDEGGAESKASEKSMISDLRSTTNDASKDLTEDEELLLDRYRQFSQSDRTKLRLTCVSPQGEMQEMEVALSPTSESELTKSVEGIEKDAPVMYRKMMKTGLPADLGRHKMLFEGVDSKVIIDLLDESNDGFAALAFAAVENDAGEELLNLSPEEETVASKYRKMLKMGIPSDAVRHKMTSDEICPKILAAVLDEINPNEAQEKLGDEDEKIVAKYRNMIKMGVPIDGIRRKMTMEGLNAKDMNAVMDVSPKQQTMIGAIQLSSEDDAIAEKYRMMLKMGVPLDGVKHKMDLEGVDLKIVSAVEQGASMSSAAGDGSISVDPPKKSTKSTGPTLSNEEEAIAAKYRNMLKVCIPKEAVRHKMKQEGVSDKIADAVLGRQTDGGNGPDHALLPNANSRKTIAFHWTTSNLAPELLEQSIFGRTELKKRKLVSINPEELDIKKLEELFQKRQNNIATKKAAGLEENSSDMAKILDLTRANNIAISLKAFNDFTFRSLAETINDIDPDFKIDGERVQFIPNLLPTAKELQAIKKYDGGDDKLISAELFFRQLLPIKRIDDKVKVMRAMSMFDEHIQETQSGFKILQEVCGQIMNSEKLIQVLEMVLNIGNLMNAGTLDGGVEAFKFESLSKLSQTKSADGKTTILDYIVEAFIKKGERQSLLLLSEFPDIQESCRLSIGDLMNDMTSLRNDLKLCKNELTSMKRDQSSKRLTRSISKKMSDKSNVDDPKGALFDAIKSRGSKMNRALSTNSDPRQALFAAIKNRKNADSAETDGESPLSDVQYSPGVHRLQKFLTHSKSILSIAEKDQDAAVRACKGLAVYCGEEGGERSAPALLQVLSNFAQSLESGVKKYDDRVELEKRKLAKREKEKGKENRLNAIRPLTTTPKSSSFQHIGVTVNDRALAEGKGRVKEALHPINNDGSQQSDYIPCCDNMNTNPRQALLASIKNRRASFSSHRPPDAVSDRIRHIDNNIARKESRVLLVNRMLSEAPVSVKQDFLKGVTYKQTSDPLLKKIYETEGAVESSEAEKNWKAVDPRQELLKAIQSRKI